MSQFDKLLQRISSLDKNLRFDEIQKVLEYYGFSMGGPAGGSSHKTFRKEGRNPITIPKHNPIKRIYIEKVRELVELELSFINDDKKEEDQNETSEPENS